MKFQNYSSLHKGFITKIAFILMILLYLNLSSVTFGKESTSSADNAATTSASVKTKLDELKSEIASKAAKLREAINKRLQNKAYIGLLKSKSESSLTLSSTNGPRIITITEDSAFENQIKGKKASLNTLSVEDYLIALGDVDETGVLTAKKIILTKQPQSSQKKYFWGQVTTLSDNLSTIKLHDNKLLSLILPKNHSVRLSSIVIVGGIINENQVLKADFVHTPPQTSTSKLSFKDSEDSTKEASLSTKVKNSTPEAKPSSKPKSKN